MNPWLVYTEQLRLPTYFTALMVGFALATGVLRREARREGLPTRVVMDFALAAVPAVLIGARAAHVLFEAPAAYWQNPWAVFSPEGGWVFYGGLGAGIPALWAYARARGIDPWTLADIYSPAIPFGLIFGRLGCLGAGCCFGRPADWPLGVAVPWSVRYLRRGHLPDELLGVDLHPAPLYAAGFALTLFTVLSALRGQRRPPGEVFLIFVASYGVGRSILEVFRADAERGVYLGGLVSTSQVIGVLTALLALSWLVIRRCTPSSSR